MANTFGARNSRVIFEENSTPKMLLRTGILHCNMRGKICNVFDD